MKSIQLLFESSLRGDLESACWLLAYFLSTILVFGIVWRVSCLVIFPKLGWLRTYDEELPPKYQEGPAVIGNILAFAKGPLGLVQRGYAACGDIFRLKVVHKNITFLVGPKAHEVMFQGTDEELDQNEVYAFSVPIFGRGIVYDAPLDKRLQQLRIMSAALRPARMYSYVSQMVLEAVQFFRKWGEQGQVDILESLSDLIILTASRCLMGREVREHLFEKVSKLYHDLDQGMQPISVFAPYLPISAHRKRDKAREEMIQLFHGVIQNRRMKGVKEDDMLQTFMDASYRDGSRPSEREVAGLLIALLFAGQHTSSITSSWTGLLLLRNKQVLERVLKEQESIMSEFGDELNYEALSKMNLLHMCVKETLRMYPPLILLMRKVLKPQFYKGYMIPENDIIMTSPAASGRLESVFKNPNVWDPDRFGPEREEDRKHPYSFIGFGGGRHACMGEQFAYLQIKTIWSVLLRSFDFEPLGDLPQPDYNAMVVGPKPPCVLSYRKKKDSFLDRFAV
eukprot:jgi/Galph1/747/GphlegSOOS_G5526.1